MWTNENIGRHVKHLCMGTRGGSLDLSALNHVTKLKTLKIHSRNAIVGREGISKNEFANFYRILDNSAISHSDSDLSRLLEKKRAHEGLLTKWIEGQEELETLKLQFLNVLPPLSHSRLSTVRLRRCHADLYWSYVQLPAITSLSIQEPTINMQPTKTLGKPGLTYEGNTINDGNCSETRLKHNQLHPLPDSFASSAAKITSLSLCAFRVENDDLTDFLSPFTNLTYLSLATAYIKVLPAMPSLKTLVLRDIIYLVESSNYEKNVFRTICELKSLESLTLDNVLSARPGGTPRFRIFPDIASHDEIDAWVSKAGVNPTVRNLTLGFSTLSLKKIKTSAHLYIPLREDIMNSKAMLQRMFPKVSHLKFIITPLKIETDYFTFTTEGFADCMRFRGQRNIPNQKFKDRTVDTRYLSRWKKSDANPNPQTIFRGWDLVSVKLYLKGIDFSEAQNWDRFRSPRNENYRNSLARIAHCLLKNFKLVEDLKIQIKCSCASMRSTLEIHDDVLFHDDDAAKTTIQLAPYSGDLKTFKHLRLRDNDVYNGIVFHDTLSFANGYKASVLSGHVNPEGKEACKRPCRILSHASPYFEVTVLDENGEKNFETSVTSIDENEETNSETWWSADKVHLSPERNLSPEEVTNVLIAIQELDIRDPGVDETDFDDV